MKKNVAKKLSVIMIISMCIILFLNLLIQINLSFMNATEYSKTTIEQIKNIININEAEVLAEKESLKSMYISRAKTVAYIINHHSDIKESREELLKIADVVDVDEIHIFDKTGKIVYGTNPEYYGLTVDSGEQIGFFKQMLENQQLELCQDVTPNTAESKSMMYATVWLVDGSGFVQIGVEPDRLIEAMQRNELDYIFSRMASGEDCEYYAINKETNIVEASTLKKNVGKIQTEVNIAEKMSDKRGFCCTIFDQGSYCYFVETDEYYLGVVKDANSMYFAVFRSMMFVLVYLSIITVTVITMIMKIIDSYIIKGIDELVSNVQDISDGNLNTIIDLDNAPEFVALSKNINRMTDSLLNNTLKLSNVLDSADILIAVYEYDDGSDKVLATGKLAAILCLSNEQEKELLEDKNKFKERVEYICSKPVEGYDDVYEVNDISTTYLKVNEYSNESGTYGVITDVTEELNEKIVLQHERDYDILTELYNRRAFYREMDELKEKPEIVKESMLIMFDLDRLKFINDTFGHAYGDEAIRKAAQIISSADTDNKIVARVSGDEFVTFIYGAESKEELRKYVEHIYETMIESYIDVRDEEVQIRLSGGYIFCEGKPLEHTILMELVDNALYESKKGGRGRFTEYNDK